MGIKKLKKRTTAKMKINIADEFKQLTLRIK